MRSSLVTGENVYSFRYYFRAKSGILSRKKLCIQSDDIRAERFETGIMELPAISDTEESDTVQKLFRT
jgi:hypothetical protein